MAVFVTVGRPCPKTPHPAPGFSEVFGAQVCRFLKSRQPGGLGAARRGLGGRSCPEERFRQTALALIHFRPDVTVCPAKPTGRQDGERETTEEATRTPRAGFARWHGPGVFGRVR